MFFLSSLSYIFVTYVWKQNFYLTCNLKFFSFWHNEVKGFYLQILTFLKSLLHLVNKSSYNLNRTKLDNYIEFPVTGLDMSGYLLENQSGTRLSSAGSSLYDLAAVIVHHGSGTGSGHYTAFATNNKVIRNIYLL